MPLIMLYAIIPIIKEAIKTFRKNFEISLPPNWPIFFLKIIKSALTLMKPDIEVARASPPALSGTISMRFNIILLIKAKQATLTGVRVSCIE